MTTSCPLVWRFPPGFPGPPWRMRKELLTGPPAGGALPDGAACPGKELTLYSDNAAAGGLRVPGPLGHPSPPWDHWPVGQQGSCERVSASPTTSPVSHLVAGPLPPGSPPGSHSPQGSFPGCWVVALSLLGFSLCWGHTVSFPHWLLPASPCQGHILEGGACSAPLLLALLGEQSAEAAAFLVQTLEEPEKRQ